MMRDGRGSLKGSSTMKKVYLSGPISGYSYEEVTAWRNEVRERLEATGLYDCLDPMRGKHHLENKREIDNTAFEGVDGYLTVFNRDRWDVKRSDIIFMNLAGAKGPSIGSCFELAWAHELDKYVIVVMEKDDPHWHTFVHKAASVVFTDLEEAILYMEEYLLQ